MHKKGYPMEKLSLVQMDAGRELYDVWLGGASVGLVWKGPNSWHAHPSNMSDPKIVAVDLEAAVQALLAEIAAVRADGQSEERAVRDPSPE